MKRSFGPKQMTRADDTLRFESWLFGAAPEKVLSVDIATVQRWHSRLEPRLVETKLLARQDALRRQAEGRDAG